MGFDYMLCTSLRPQLGGAQRRLDIFWQEVLGELLVTVCLLLVHLFLAQKDRLTG